jgi:hypothetical protein
VGYSKIVIRRLNLKGLPCSHDFIRVIHFLTMCQCSSIVILGVKRIPSHVSLSRKKVVSAIKNILFLHLLLRNVIVRINLVQIMMQTRLKS